MLSFLKKQTIQAKHPLKDNNIAVLVPCHNTPQFIMQHCLQSIQQQTHHNLTIIIYRDGGQRMDWINDLDDPRIIFLESNTNNNIGYARNALLDSIPDYCSHFCFVDSDDIIMPRHIEVMNHYIGSHDYIDNINVYQLLFKKLPSAYSTLWMKKILNNSQTLTLGKFFSLINKTLLTPYTIIEHRMVAAPLSCFPAAWGTLYSNNDFIKEIRFPHIPWEEDALWSLKLAQIMYEKYGMKYHYCKEKDFHESAYVYFCLNKKNREKKYHNKTNKLNKTNQEILDNLKSKFYPYRIRITKRSKFIYKKDYDLL